jgi:hypothetical protein
MTQRYRKFKRSWGMWYAFDNATGNSVSLKTRVKAEAVQKVNAMNETERQPSISLGLARVYLNATDPKLATRTWREVMENIVAKKTDETRRRWEVAILPSGTLLIQPSSSTATARRATRWMWSFIDEIRRWHPGEGGGHWLFNGEVVFHSRPFHHDCVTHAAADAQGCQSAFGLPMCQMNQQTRA